MHHPIIFLVEIDSPLSFFITIIPPFLGIT